jgi:predicted amidohydrolase
MKKLAVTLVQSSLSWENPPGNFQHLDKLLAQNLKSSTDLIVLPEMFTTGFTMKPEKNGEKHAGAGLQWMKQKAKQYNCVVTGSICVEENGNYFNRLYWVNPDGKYDPYNKRHLFRMGQEHNHYTMGDKKISPVLHAWKMRPLVCYDLRFPVWSRNRWEAGSPEPGVQSPESEVKLVADYDVLIYVANWPEARAYAWKHLLIARAIENQCYVIGVNRVGADGNMIMHSGDSVVVNPLGEIISHIKPHQEQVETLELDYEFLKELRKKFPVGLDADSFELKEKKEVRG